MDQRILAYLLSLWVLVAVTAGIALIIFGSTTLTTVGAVLIIIGVVSLMPAFRYLWWDPEPAD